MDANCKEKRREWGLQPPKIVGRHDRFSMDPQRFDEILAEITTGYSNIRSSFENVNIAEILEEMVTEYARAALEAEAAPKFAELAVLLHHCAALYGRKVDYLYQHVVDVSETLTAPTPAPAPAPGEQPQTPEGTPGARRRRRASAAVVAAGFAHIAVPACSGAARAREPPRPPPTLPRMYIELEPRAPAPHDQPLRDAAGEPVGLPADYHVSSRLHDGYLVEELEAGGGGGGALRPLSLLELQEALAAAAPLDPPPLLSPPLSSPRLMSPPPSPPPLSPEAAPPALHARRKRRSSDKLEDIVDTPLKAFVTRQVRAEAARRREFRPPAAWLARVVRRRARALLLARRSLARLHAEFRGFEDQHPDAGGFLGWTHAECAEARALADCASLHVTDLESDDDGFFEGSSFSSLDSSRSTPPPRAPPAPPPEPRAAPGPGPAAAPGPAPAPAPAPAPDAEADEWGARIAARALAEEGQGVDVRALSAAVLRALPAEGALPFTAVLRRAAAAPRDVSRLLLATLFLANSGNLTIGGEPRAFSVQLVSTDERLYAAAADAEAALLAPPPPEPPEPPAGPA